MEKARRIVLEHGWNSTVYQILNPGIDFWFPASGHAVVGQVRCRRVRVVAGAPAASKERLKAVSDEFEADAAARGDTVCYFCAEARLENVYSASVDHSKVLLGAQPVWDPKNWATIVSGNKNVRSQINRARNKNVVVSEWSIDRAEDHPELVETLQAWLDSKGLPPLHFMVEPQTLSDLQNRRVFVAERDSEVNGFVVLSPVPTRNGWLFEQFVHRPSSPNGTVELMIDFAMRALAESGSDYATLGLSPLSKRADIDPFENPLWLRFVLAWMRKHGQRFYNFDGLDAFKAKFQPEMWEPVFAISNEKNFSFKTLKAIAAAFSNDEPLKLFLGGLWRAFRTELTWLKGKIYSLK